MNVLQAFDGLEAVKQLDELADLYAEVYTEPPYNGAAKYSRERFVGRTVDQCARSGFTLITAQAERALTGFTFGFTMLPGSWWANCPLPDRTIVSAAKFAVIELVVAAQYRGQGLGRRLLDQVLDQRPEAFATLASLPESPAHALYLRWGWQVAGRFTGEPPYPDALVLPLAG